MKRTIAILLLFSISASAEEHRFWSRKARISTAIHAGLRTVDSAQTCIKMRQPGWREVNLPLHSCGSIAAFELAMVPAEISARWLLHRAGLHSLETPNTLLWTVDDARSIYYSSTH